MANLFGGIDPWNVPAFIGQKIANDTGAGAASAFSGGMSAGKKSGRGPAFEAASGQASQDMVSDFSNWSSEF